MSAIAPPKKTSSRPAAAAKIPVSRPELPPDAPAKKRAPRKRAAGTAIDHAERHHLIEVAAYYIAEKRGFHSESSHDDWLRAERDIDAMIAAGRFAS